MRFRRDTELELCCFLIDVMCFRRDMELELRCFMIDEFETADWPMSVTVSVNSVQLQPHQRRPLGIKSFCRPGMNLLQINTSGCCCVSVV